MVLSALRFSQSCLLCFPLSKNGAVVLVPGELASPLLQVQKGTPALLNSEDIVSVNSVNSLHPKRCG